MNLRSPFLLILFLSVLFNFKPAEAFYIYNGLEAEVGQFPFVVQLNVDQRTPGLCSGTYIGPRHILTAAHCMCFYDKSSDQVRAAEGAAVQVSFKNTQDQNVYRSLKIRVHPRFSCHEYYRLNRRDVDHDLAIVTLKKNPTHSPAELDFDNIGLQKKYIIAGYGETKMHLKDMGVFYYGHLRLEGLSESLRNIFANPVVIPKRSTTPPLSPKGEMSVGLDGDSGGPLLTADGKLRGVYIASRHQDHDANGDGIWESELVQMTFMNLAFPELKKFVQESLAIPAE